ncbi:hypothetical protein BH23CHL8_BH23CHL8_21320 [soil metagenome]
MDAPLRELFERVGPHADLAHPDLPTIAAALLDLAADHDYLAPVIARMADVSGAQPLHMPPSGPRLSLVHRKAGQMSAVHDHGVWVALAPVVGIETHRRYRPLTPSDRATLRVAEDQPLGPAECVTLQPPDDIHDHGHLTGRGDAAWVLILLGDDQFQRRRSEWDPTTGRRRALEPGDQGRWLASEPFPD